MQYASNLQMLTRWIISARLTRACRQIDSLIRYGSRYALEYRSLWVDNGVGSNAASTYVRMALVPQLMDMTNQEFADFSDSYINDPKFRAKNIKS